MIAEQTQATFRDPLPDAVDVAVIGAGIAGTATAYFLARAGVSVLLCEKGQVAGEQSGRNWGWVRQQGRDEAELPIMMEANRLWRGLAEETGEPGLGFHALRMRSCRRGPAAPGKIRKLVRDGPTAPTRHADADPRRDRSPAARRRRRLESAA